MKDSNILKAESILKQYKMFSKALNFVEDDNDRRDIAGEMDKLEVSILDLTDISYNMELEKILNEKTSFLKEERLKLQRLVDIISSRVEYVTRSLKRHKLTTGNDIVRHTINEEENLSKYSNGIRIIDKYRDNVKNKTEIINDIKTLDIKIAQAKDRLDSNKKNNDNMERRFISILSKAFEKYNCYDLKNKSSEIDSAYNELQNSLSTAHENVRVAKLGNNADIIRECDNMLSSITLEYEKYKEKKYILELMNIYKNVVNDYDELMIKREKVNDILKNISGSDVYLDTYEEITKQYNIIRLEKQDMDTYNSLCEDKESKENIIKEIDIENKSKEFTDVLDVFIQNEKKYKEELYLEQQKREYAERQKKLLKDKEIQEERNRRQKLLEEERNKDIANDTRQLLMAKKNSPLNERRVQSTVSSMPKLEEKPKVEVPRVEEKKIVNDEPFFDKHEMEDLKKHEENSSWF